eukprot:SAG31_NODE_1245_length_9134_cov_6.012064_4_plen_146_part_00
MPLALCSASSVPNEDLVTFEINYSDRTGENYVSMQIWWRLFFSAFCVVLIRPYQTLKLFVYGQFSRYSDTHEWFYYPRMTRDEVLLIKCWDSAGAGFSSGNVPATFSLHTAFDDPTTLTDAPTRVSLEVRTVAFFDDPSDDVAKL